MSNHLVDGVGIHHLVTPVFRTVGAAASVTGDGTVHHNDVDDLVVVRQFFIIIVKVVLHAIDVADIQLVFEVGTMGLALFLIPFLREEVSVLLLDVVIQLQLNGIPQGSGECLRHVRTEVPFLVVQD